MTRYIVRFMKDVVGENGHVAEICQRSIEIEASSRGHAAELAKIRREQKCDQQETACPANENGSPSLPILTEPTGKACKGKDRDEARSSRHAVDHGRD